MTVLFFLSLLFFPSYAQAQKALLLFGGQDQKVFLGCLNCNEFDRSSVCNEFGSYGSQFSRLSIWNSFGSYGSPFSPYSPWNGLAANPPVIVDKDGNSYGYFTANPSELGRTRIPALVVFLDWMGSKTRTDLSEARDFFCKVILR